MDKVNERTVFKIPDSTLSPEQRKDIVAALAAGEYQFLKAISEELYKGSQAHTEGVEGLPRGDEQKVRVQKIASRIEKIARLVERGAELAMRL